MSATPPPTASSTSKAGTTSPAADTLICSRPPDIAAIRSAMRSADSPGPGRRFGHDVTMRQRLPCARATEGAANVAVPAAISVRRVGVMNCLLPPGMKVMHRAMALPDLELVGTADRLGDVLLGVGDRLAQPLALGGAGRDRGR